MQLHQSRQDDSKTQETKSSNITGKNKPYIKHILLKIEIFMIFSLFLTITYIFIRIFDM